MHLRDLFEAHNTAFSFEFFPPKSEAGGEELFRAIAHLEELKPSHVSVTYGAGGTTREVTQNLVYRLRRETELEVMPHLTCVMHTEAEIYDILEGYARAGIKNILALGGDPPKSALDYDRTHDAFRYASDLVRFIRRFQDRYAGSEIGDPRGFGIAVAGFPEGHPGTPNRMQEIDHLKAKVDEGADAIITQLFFDNRDFYDFRERCEIAGITIPILAGIMPITSRSNFERVPSLALGARYPARLIREITAWERDDDVEKAGVAWASQQAVDLVEQGVRGLHFYTLNRLRPVREVWRAVSVQG